MMGDLERKYVSRLVPKNPRITATLLVLVAIVNSMTLGYDTSMLNGLNMLPQYKDYFHPNTATTGLNNASLWIGNILGCFLIQPVPDRLGRKPAILGSALICVVGCIIQGAAQNMAILIAVGINYHMVNIPTTWAWRIPSILQCVPSLLAICFLPFVPESPRWLLANNQPEAAKEVLAVVIGVESLEEPDFVRVFNDISTVLETEAMNHPENAWKEIFTGKPNRRRLAILVSFGVMVQLLGNFVAS
ncbi:hexose transporter-like protein [Penicillium vulpinum]|uniref:hexose transporter-like protein n=1 Tax=Penicillium vulpinum TaxID=29845 RepID=UPI0025468AE9|nr:hexose transporter-like protein [Penicillium vulpinum]KAJ5971235.1 hexose transporter-like protein [Penicillium vulpinum]